MERLRPETPAEACDIIASAAADGVRLGVEGGGTKRALGRPMEVAATLSTAALSRILSYEPEELVLTVEAGARVHDVMATIARRSQTLAFEPSDISPLLGASGDAATVGGLVAASTHGSRRFKAGGVRDHLLGFKAINGYGELIASGGRVMKNVSGFDLSKLVTGSFGTLAVLTELTFRLWPCAETAATLTLHGLADRKALEILCEIACLPIEASGLAHLTAGAVSGLAHMQDAGSGPLTAIRLEGVCAAIDERIAFLMQRFRAAGPRRMHADMSEHFWHEISDLRPLTALDGAVWRLSAAPASMPTIIATIGPRAVIYDGAGSFATLVVDEIADAEAELIQATVAAHGGHATLLRGSSALRTRIDVFPPLDLAHAALSRRIKAAFDPKFVLNPGRMYRDM